MKGYNFKMKRIIILKQNGENIRSLIITDNDLIIEIGPGQGALTKKLDF